MLAVVQVVRQQAVMSSMAADLQAWEDALAKHAATHAQAAEKLKVLRACNVHRPNVAASFLGFGL